MLDSKVDCFVDSQMTDLNNFQQTKSTNTAQEVLALASGEGQLKAVAAKAKTPGAPVNYSQSF